MLQRFLLVLGACCLTLPVRAQSTTPPPPELPSASVPAPMPAPVAVPPPPMVVAPSMAVPPPPMPAPPGASLPALDWLDARRQQDFPLRQAFLPSLRTLGPDEGLVRFAVITNDVRARRPDIVVLVNDTTQFELRPVSDGQAVNAGLYVGVVPAGRYTVRRLDDRVAFRWIAFNGLTQRALGEFDVKAGAAADLGTIVLVPVTTDSYQLARLEYRTPETEWQRAAPDSMARWQALPAGGGWRGNQWPVAAGAAKRAPVGIQQLRELEDGTLLMPTAMGRLRVRSPQGDWRELSGPRPTPFVWVAPGSTPGEFVALGEGQSLVRFAPDGTPTEQVLQGLGDGRLLLVAFGQDGYWYVVQEQRLALKLLRTRALDAGTWEDLGGVAQTESLWSGNRGAFGVDTTDGILLVQGSKGLLRHYSYATGRFTDRQLTDQRDILSVDVMPDGTVSVLTVGAGALAGVFSGAWISRDRGLTWREINTGYKVKVTPLVLPGDGRILQAGGVFGDSGIKVSLDEGKTWSQLTEALPVESKVVATRTLGLLAVRRMGVQDILLRSTDGGRTWVYEWSSLERTGVERVLRAEADERAARAAKRAAAKR